MDSQNRIQNHNHPSQDKALTKDSSWSMNDITVRSQSS